MTPRVYTPRPYQQIISQHILKHKRCAIWAGMGLGKSVSTLTALDIIRTVGEDPRPALVLAPLRVAQTTWPDECAKWQHLSDTVCQPVIGSAAERKDALRNRDAHVFSINYENIPWLIDQLAGEWPFGTVVADESTKLKGLRVSWQVSKTGKRFLSGQGGERTKALAKIAGRTDRWINLTGTPAPNGLKDLWGQSWFLDGGKRLGNSFTAFQNRWFQLGYDGYSIKPLPHAQGEIEAMLSDICISLNAADYFDLNAPIVTRIGVDLPPKARALYADMERDMFMELEGNEVEAFGAAARTNKCLQLANGAAYVDKDAEKWAEVHAAKLDALEDIIEESAGAPILVAYNFRSDLERLQRRFPKGRLLDKRASTIREWNEGSIPLLFAHPASAGHGLNLQDGGNILVFFGHNWNLEEHQQIIERIGPARQMQAGHNRPVFLYHIVANDTIEEQVMERLTTKREVQDLLLEAMKARKR